VKNIARIFFTAVLLTGFLLAYFPAKVYATHGFELVQITFRVEGQSFEVWGYDGDGLVPAIRLQDFAYILQNTPAQFDIRESDDPNVDFWIVRGDAYTPVGTELSVINEYRWARFGSLGYFDWHGFDAYPIQTVVIGFDGHDSPLTSIAAWVIQDVDYIYFPVENLSHLLGFTLRWVWDDGTRYEIITSTRTATELPMQTPQLSRLLSQLTGQWVDRAHLYSTSIDETVIWPVELEFSFHGFTDIVNMSVAPVWTGKPIFPQLWYPLIIRELELGLIELTVLQGSLPSVSPRDASMWDDELPELDHDRFENHRIVISSDQTEIVYYIDDIPHTMIRRHWDQQPYRYTVEAAEYGGIILRYVISSGLDNIRQEILVFRSAEEGERGTNPIYRQLITNPHDNLLWQFTDTDVEHGYVYYYTLILLTNWGERNISPNWQPMRVDVNEVLGEPEPQAVPALVPVPVETPSPDSIIIEPASTNPWSIAGNIIALVMGVSGLIWLVIHKYKNIRF